MKQLPRIASGRKAWLTYGGIALAIMLPMLFPGYIFALDMAFTPEIRLPEYVTSSFPFYVLLHLLNTVIPSQIIQKALLFSILVLSGLGMHYLMLWLQRDKPQDTYITWGANLAGALYMINPFTYSRFMVGQFAVLLGYALLPFFARALLRLYTQPDTKRALQLGLWMAAIGAVSIHTIGLAALLVATSIPLMIHRHKANPGYLALTGKRGLLSITVAIALSGYWLLPLALGNSTVAQAIDGFNGGDQRAFATVGNSIIDRIVNVMQLQGFWAEKVHSYLLPQNALIVWPLVVIGFWALIINGLARMWRDGKRFELLLFGAASGVAILLATTPLTAVLANHIGFFAGYREPQKFIALVALLFAIACGYAASHILRRLQSKNQEARLGLATFGLILLPVALTPTMFWAFGNQLLPRDYPKDWYVVNQYLSQDQSDAKAIFLPWHLYMKFSFTDRVVVNPAGQFFDRPTLVSNDLEYADASPTMPDNKKTTLGHILQQAQRGNRDLSQALAYHQIGYVLVAKENDYKSFDFIMDDPDLKLVKETPSLKLYRNYDYGRQP